MSDTQAIIDQLSEAQMSFDQSQCQAALRAGQRELERLRSELTKMQSEQPAHAPTSK